MTVFTVRRIKSTSVDKVYEAMTHTELAAIHPVDAHLQMFTNSSFAASKGTTRFHTLWIPKLGLITKVPQWDKRAYECCLVTQTLKDTAPHVTRNKRYVLPPRKPNNVNLTIATTSCAKAGGVVSCKNSLVPRPCMTSYVDETQSLLCYAIFCTWRSVYVLMAILSWKVQVGMIHT